MRLCTCTIRKWRNHKFGWTLAKLRRTSLLSAVRIPFPFPKKRWSNRASFDSHPSPSFALFIVKRQVTLFSSAEEACKGAEAVVIATEWKEFLSLNWETIYASMNKPAFVFDGRLIVDADKLREIGFKVCLATSYHFFELMVLFSGYVYR